MDYGADLVIYGDLVISPTDALAKPYAYIASKRFRDAEELTGFHPLGNFSAGDDIRANAVANHDLKAKLVAQIPALTQFVVGLGNYRLDKIPMAESHFEQAIQESNGSPDPNIGKVYYLFAGKAAEQNAAAQTDAEESRELANAQTYYRKALDMSQEFARAQLGYADTLFQQSRDDCQPGVVKEAGLNQALEGYQLAKKAQDQVPNAEIDLKAAFYLGRIYWCLSRACVTDDWTIAAHELQTVISAYENAGPDEQNSTVVRASEAYAILGLIRWEEPGPTHDLNVAAACLQRAIDENAKLTSKPRQDRQALFYSVLANIYEQLTYYDQADDAWGKTLALDGQYKNQQSQAFQRRTLPPALATAIPKACR